MIKFRLWSARLLLFLGVLTLVAGALSLKLAPIIAGAVLLGLGHSILAVHELSAHTKALLGVAHGRVRRERTREIRSSSPLADEPAGPGLRDDPAASVDPYTPSRHPAGARG